MGGGGDFFLIKKIFSLMRSFDEYAEPGREEFGEIRAEVGKS